MEEDTKTQEAVLVEELPDTSQYKGRHPRALAQKVKEIKTKNEEAKKSAIELIRHQKVEEFVQQLFLSNGNVTEAAMIVFKPKNRAVASVIGSKLMKNEAGAIIQQYFDKKGITYGFLIDHAKEKMLDSKTPEWWDRMMKMAGYADFLAQQKEKSTGPTVNILNVQKEISSEYIEGEVVENDE